MDKYPALKNILSALFSVETGLDDSPARQAFLRAYAADEELRAEIQEALRNTDTRWKDLLYNDEYEVIEADSEEEARAYAVEILAPP